MNRAFQAFADGASSGNPGPSGIGVRIQDTEGHVYLEESASIGWGTNNRAEYVALLRALIECLFLQAEQVELFSDSELVVRQMRGEYRVKDKKLRALHYLATELCKKFAELKITHIPREENTIADKLAREGAKKGG